ncbi:DUF2642 domain-containing protein [Paenibacillus sp. OAS669]|uniref:DUF2642 domain-containing protein n=1 Tax=Paenibacillus sp. OAS669 TaxID=2663821 RepID=UPI00178AD7DA|nr:DUF2642 domain-containing protein [Paenibacillus sp. OAS669]MBE1440718.1 hypothetical protein [Paenibacillus sp. OAS669]
MTLLNTLLDKQVELHISGKKTPIRGKLINLGSDIMVIYNGQQFLYIPLLHLQQLTQYEESKDEAVIVVPAEMPFEDQKDISFRKILMNAKGMFTEIYTSGNQSLHGYVTSIMNDYFVFYSPVYHVVYIPMQHMKYLKPYDPNVTPYSLNQERFPLSPSTITLARTFDQQLKKLEGQFVVLDIGENPNKIGQLKSLQNNLIEMVAAGGETLFLHMEHVKTVHLP